MPSVTIDTTVDIDAGPDAVWDVLTDFARYSEWNPVMRIEGTPEVGTKLVVHLTQNGGTGMSVKPKCSQRPPARNCDGWASSDYAASRLRRRGYRSNRIHRLILRRAAAC